VNQYNNLDNAQAHFKTTGKEIWEQTNGKVTHFVMGGSTGGSIMGVGRLLKSKAQTTKIVLADPEKSYLGALVEGRDGGEAVGAAAVEKVKGLLESTGEIELEGVGKACLTGIMKSGGSSPSVLKFVDFSVPVNGVRCLSLPGHALPPSPLLRLVFLRPHSFFDFEVEDFVAF
jgi:hypothetical protein